jgi:putative cardiolipin synthase
MAATTEHERRAMNHHQHHNLDGRASSCGRHRAQGRIPFARIALIACALLALGGCATIDFDYPRDTSSALRETGDTRLATAIDPVVAARPADQAGFYALNDGIDALTARLLLARHADRSIDVQYYLIKDGLTGRAFIHELLRAADRGVRVRLLIDDMFTGGKDEVLAALHAHPNFEIRIVNPFHRGAIGRPASFLIGFSRVNRRMHNKSFTVDNRITILGGRNIADEYFGAREDAKFGDLDVLAVGSIVQEVSDQFDAYWNHETALPVPAFVKYVDDADAALAALRTSLDDVPDELRDSRYAEAVEARYRAYLEPTDDLFEWAPYELVYDSPDKAIKGRMAEADSIVAPIAESIRAAEDELIVVSPYFVPTRAGIRQIADLERRGVDVTVITNSLAANNQFAVHGGYAPSRKPLLEAGVRIHEARPDAEVAGTEFVDASGAKATLHTKAYIVDGEEVFIGSFNFDPRSGNLNSEIGVIIRDPELASRYAERVEAALPEQTFEVFLEEGKLRWRGRQQGRETIYTKEPETTWGQRALAWFARILPRSQL